MPRPLPPLLGLTLTFLRVVRGWSQQDLAETVGISGQTICKYENGKGAVLDVGRIERMARLMGYAREHVAVTLLYLGALLPVAPAVGPGPVAPMPRDHRRARRLAIRLGLVEAHRVQLLLRGPDDGAVAGAGGGTTCLPCLTLKLLRIGRGWTQAELAAAAGVKSSRVNVYEAGESRVRPALMARMASSMGYGPDHLTLTALYLRALLPLPRDEQDRSAWAIAIREGLACARRSAVFLLDLARGRRLQEARCEAESQWQVLRRLPAARQLEQIAGTVGTHPWALVERLCDESVAAAGRDAAESLRLATLALKLAELAPGVKAWLLAYAWAFIGNAHRIRFHRDRAEGAFAAARRLWEENPPGPECPLGLWRILDLEASLRRDCRQFAAALDLLDRALAAAPQSAKARILLKKESILDQAGDFQAALAVLDEAAPLVEETGDATLRWTLEFNRVGLLVHLSQFAEADTQLPVLRSLATQYKARVDLMRVAWLGGRIAVGRGQRSAGRELFEQARREFAAVGFVADAAIVSLEMAALDLEEGRVEEAAAVAAEMMEICRLLRAERETLMGLRLFCEAAKAHTATAEMARHLVKNWGTLGGQGNAGERLDAG
jgi:transcriptional regulator with XRE-family HTH domain